MKRSNARALDRSILLVATIGLAGNAYGVPSRKLWDDVADDRPYILIAFLCVVGVFGALSPVEALTERRRVNRDVNIRNQILSVFGQLLKLGSRTDHRLEMTDLGLHIWKRRRTLRHPVRGVLMRAATYRLGTTPVVRPFSAGRATRRSVSTSRSSPRSLPTERPTSGSWLSTEATRS